VTEWSDIARATIERIALTIPDDTPFKERKRLVDDAYPFGPRQYWPYKAWLKARKAYLKPYDPKSPPTPLFPELPRDPVTGRPVIA